MKDKSLLLWVAGFAGVLLLYSAYKGKSPLSLIQGSPGITGATPDTVNPGDTGPQPVPGAQGPGATFTASSAVNNTGFDANGFDTDIPDTYQFSPGTFVPSQNSDS